MTARVLGIIPARGGSTRIPRKNLETVGDMSLLSRAMISAKRSKLLTDWRVSTDDVDVALACMMLDTNPRRVLSRHTSKGDGPMVAVAQEALSDLAAADFEAVCLIQPTSPFRTAEDIDACIALLTPSVRSVVSVDAQTGKRNGAVYVTRVEMLRDGFVFDDESRVYRMPSNRSVDINEPADLGEARRIWAEREGGR